MVLFPRQRHSDIVFYLEFESMAITDNNFLQLKRSRLKNNSMKEQHDKRFLLRRLVLGQAFLSISLNK